MQIVQSLFDYDALSTEIRIIVQQRTAELREDERIFNGLMRQSVERAWQMGERLTDVQERLRGQFIAWLCSEFPHWAQRSAYRFMDVYKRFEFAKLANSNIGLSAAYLLAASTIPENARIEAIQRAEAGETITYTEAKGIIAEHRPVTGAGEVATTVQLDWGSGAVPAYQCPYCGNMHTVLLEGDTKQCPHCNQLHVYSGPRDTESYGPYRSPPPAFVPAASDHTDPYPVPSLLAPSIDYDGNEWYTPDEWIAAARQCMGHIDLDPASCDAAQSTVQAGNYFTKENNGLDKPWHGRVWLNPPYSFPEIQQFTRKAVHEYQNNPDVSAILILVNNCTDAGWFIELAQQYAVMFSRGRASFWRPDQTSFATRQGQAIFYLGRDQSSFYRAFSTLAYPPNKTLWD